MPTAQVGLPAGRLMLIEGEMPVRLRGGGLEPNQTENQLRAGRAGKAQTCGFRQSLPNREPAKCEQLAIVGGQTE